MNVEISRTNHNQERLRSSSGRIRLAIIGCGAITENAHLPAALSSSAVELVALSDINESRLRYIKRNFGLGSIVFKDYRETFDKVDAAILALPNHLHSSVGVEFLSNGIHVLCEKPLAVNSNECEQLLQAAKATSSILAVGYVTRFSPSTELTKQLIESRFLGDLLSFDYEFGAAGGWVTVSGYNLSPASSGGGVLVVSGSHFIDRMIYLFGDVEVISYSDDKRGGIEANCVAWFRANLHGQELKGRVVLSKTHKLSNRLRIVGEKGILEALEGQAHSVTYFPSHESLRHEIYPSGNDKLQINQNYFRVQLDDFVHAIHAGVLPKVDGEQGSKSVRVMESCYQIATPLQEPWCELTLERLRLAIPE